MVALITRDTDAKFPPRLMNGAPNGGHDTGRVPARSAPPESSRAIIAPRHKSVQFGADDPPPGRVGSAPTRLTVSLLVRSLLRPISTRLPCESMQRCGWISQEASLKFRSRIDPGSLDRAWGRGERIAGHQPAIRTRAAHRSGRPVWSGSIAGNKTTRHQLGAR